MQENNGRFLSKQHQALSFGEGKVCIDGIIVMSKESGRFVPRGIDDLRRIFGWPESNTTFETRLIKIAQLLNADRQFEAVFLANLGNWSDNCPIRKANFNPNEPRDDRSRWTKDGSQPTGRSDIEDVQYRGFFHDVVVDDLLRGLAANGGTVLKNIDVLGINGILAIPDGASKPQSWTKPYFIEVKTGNDPDFTPNQKQVYPLICIGGHATSVDPRITQLGLTPGVPFPPLAILLVHTYGPGMPLRYDNYCWEFGFLEDTRCSLIPPPRRRSSPSS